MDKKIFREQSLQSEKDKEQIARLVEYIEKSPGNWLSKFDNFSKYVQKNIISRFLARYEVYKKQLDVAGSIVELGVCRGGGLMTWAQLATMFEPVNYTREIFGFDTFEGFPNVHGKDGKGCSDYVHQGGLSVESGMEQDIMEAVAIYDANRPLGHIPRVRLIRGDIVETLPAFLEENPHLVISLLHLDADLYAPTHAALSMLVERIPKGGIIMFDELNCRLYPGETVALQEVLGIQSLELKRFPWTTSIAYAVV